MKKASSKQLLADAMHQNSVTLMWPVTAGFSPLNNITRTTVGFTQTGYLLANISNSVTADQVVGASQI